MSSPPKSTEKKSLSIVLRLRFTKQSFVLMKNYGSQLSTWIGLGPFVIVKYLIGKSNFNLQSSTSKKLKDFQISSCMPIVRKFNHLTMRVFEKKFQIGKLRTLIQDHNTTRRCQMHSNDSILTIIC